MRFSFLPDVKFPEGSTIAQKIGLVLWWVGVGVLLLSVALSAIAAITDTSDAQAILVVGFIFGIVSWLIGRIGLFIFSGR